MVQRRGKPPEYVLHRKERKERRNGRRASPPFSLLLLSSSSRSFSLPPSLSSLNFYISAHFCPPHAGKRRNGGERGPRCNAQKWRGPRPECEKKKRGNWAASPHTHTLSHAARPEEVCMGNARGKKVMNIIRRVRSKVPLNPSWEPRLLSTRVVMTSK